MSERPRLQDVLERMREASARGIRTWAPAKVVKWDADKQRANCQILVKSVYRDEEDERKTKPGVVVPGVPVQFPGAGKYRITFPIENGTTGALLFSHLSLDKWLSGNGREVDPEFDHAHALTDAVFFPGLHPFGAPLGDVPTDHMTAGHDDSDAVQIHFHADTVVLGEESGAEFMFLCETLNTDLKNFVTTLYTILQAGTVGGPTAQQLQQIAQYPALQLYTRMVAGGSAYLSTKIKNK
jgi:hypothetical protein